MKSNLKTFSSVSSFFLPVLGEEAGAPHQASSCVRVLRLPIPKSRFHWKTMMSWFSLHICRVMFTSRSLTLSKCFLKLLLFSFNFNLQFGANWNLKLNFKCFQLGSEWVDRGFFKGKTLKSFWSTQLTCVLATGQPSMSPEELYLWLAHNKTVSLWTRCQGGRRYFKAIMSHQVNQINRKDTLNTLHAIHLQNS